MSKTILSVAFLLLTVACGNNRSGLSISPATNVRPNSQPGASCVLRGAASVVTEFNAHTHGGTPIPAEDIVSAIEKSYATPAGPDGHYHGFTLTNAHFEDLQDNVPVSLTTYPDASGHGHQVTIYCY
jgi:hypothetical protein